MKITIHLGKDVKPKNYQRVATLRAIKQAEALGVRFIDAEVFVFLPESNRCFMKVSGETSLSSYG